MLAPVAQPLTIRISETETVSALLCRPEHARACYVLAHGAGAGMNHPFMNSVSAGLGERGLATLRYQFPFMERGSRRPDVPQVAQATVRAAVAPRRRQSTPVEQYPLQDGHVGEKRRCAQAVDEPRHDPAGRRRVRAYPCRFRGHALHPAGSRAPRVRAGPAAHRGERGGRFHLHRAGRATRSGQHQRHRPGCCGGGAVRCDRVGAHC